MVGNLPYFITSDILLRLFEFRQYFETIVLMVQREVAERLAAAPGRSDYGLLSATAQLYPRWRNCSRLPPSSFSPPPKVESTVVRLRMASKLDSLRVPEADFIDFLKLSFGQKRKTLSNNLKAQYAPKLLRAAFEKAGVKPAVRAEGLSLEKERRAVSRAVGRVIGSVILSGVSPSLAKETESKDPYSRQRLILGRDLFRCPATSVLKFGVVLP